MSETAQKFVRFWESDFGKKISEGEAAYLYRELKEAKRILDIGCGTGIMEEMLPDLNIVGIDRSIEMLEEAKKKNPNYFVLGDALNLCFREESFDATFFLTTLEFNPEFEDAVREVWTITKADGKIVVMILNPSSSYYRDRFQNTDSYFRKGGSIDLSKIAQTISSHFRITKEEYFLGVRNEDVFESTSKEEAALYVLVGVKNKIVYWAGTVCFYQCLMGYKKRTV